MQIEIWYIDVINYEPRLVFLLEMLYYATAMK